MEILAQALMYWLVLHAPGGQEISVNIRGITSMREGEGGEKNKLLTGQVHCVVAMDDGKLVNVIESCTQVRNLIKQLEQTQAPPRL